MTDGESGEGAQAGEDPVELSTYVVAMRSSAGFFFGVNDLLPPMRFPTEIGLMELSFGTARTRFPGFRNPVRAGLWADARGQAPSMAAAVETYANFARGVVAVLSVAANAPVGDLTAYLAYDGTPGRPERECWLRFLPEEPLVPRRGRRLDATLVLKVIRAWMQHVDRGAEEVERWHRAFNQYHHALQTWEPGLEIPAMGHLWVGMEALTPIALNRLLERNGMTREQLAAEWQVAARDLNAEVRRRLLFNGDNSSYREAREARNGLQHGYRALWDVRTRAMEARDQTASYLRSAIIELVGLEPDVQSVLLSPPYNRPFYWSFTVQMSGRLIGDVDQFAGPDGAHPRIEWGIAPTELPADAEGDAGIGYAYNVVQGLAEGVSFTEEDVSILGPDADDQEG